MKKALFVVGVLVLMLFVFANGASAQAPGDPVKGKTLWDQGTCKNCHGANGEGKYAGVRAGDTRVAADWIKQVRTPRANMPAFAAAQVSDQDLTDMLAYMKTLTAPTGTFTAVTYTAQPNDPPGKVLMTQKRCWGCHGDNPIGGVLAQGRFVNQGRAPSAEIVIKQLRTPAQRMPSFSATQVTDAEAAQIADYLKSLAATLTPATPAPAATPAAAPAPAPVAQAAPVKVATGGDGMKNVFVRAAGTNEDPFGGLPINTSSGLGAASKFGVGGPGVFAAPGGKPSDKSGDGTSPRKAIFIGGAWAMGPAVGGNVGYRAANENPEELPSCATVKSPAGVSRWFKMDTWQNKKLQIWLDDELNTATAPSGSAVFGAGDNWMVGLNQQSAWAVNGWDWVIGAPANPYYADGWVLAVYDPTNMQPNFAYEAPNATLYTLTTSGTGSLRRSGQGAPLADSSRGVSGTGIIYGSGVAGAFSNVHGYATYNKNQPSHLLWWEGVMDGWVHTRVYNQMIWDGVVTVCSYRAGR